MKLQDLIDEQKLLCEEFDSTYIEVKADDLIAVALDSIKQEPLVGIRKRPTAGETVTWYIYGGELQSNDEDFEIMSVKELQEILPEVLPYLALDHGYRFMIDQDDYEDVWKEDAF